MEGPPQLYENTRYNFDRNERKTVTIYTTTAVGTMQLHEPLRIDKHSDVYIDSFISNNGTTTASGDEVFLLGVEEFNIKHISNEAKYNNKVIIPNINTRKNVDTTITHRATKFNYVGTINPCTLTKLTISLTANNLGVLETGHYWITFVIVARD